jgi:apolipoprotein N-acyltransferase
VRAAVTLSAAPRPTLYDQTGDAFGWLCLAIAGAFVIANIFVRRGKV